MDSQRRMPGVVSGRAVAESGEAMKVLYHGGAPGFRVGDVIQPHDTKLRDDCAICQAHADDSHRPDRVFATPVRIYAKHYASKYGFGSVYIVEAVGELERSEADSIETYHAPALTVTKVSETYVALNMSERRRLYRLWGDADDARGWKPNTIDLRIKRFIGMRV